MENQQNNMLKLAMTYGLYLAGIGIVISIITWAVNLMEILGLFGAFFIGILQLIILVFLLIYFTKLYRNNQLAGKITFGQAFVFGVLLVLCSTVVTSLYSYIFNKFIDPEYASRIVTMIQDKTVQFMANQKVPQDKIDETITKFQEQGIPSAIDSLVSSLKFGLIGGAIMSLISSAIVKKNITSNDAFTEAMEDIKTEE
jgi:prepilin signal peptidase PulO-like enzyme (type II secretory pathway)